MSPMVRKIISGFLVALGLLLALLANDPASWVDKLASWQTLFTTIGRSLSSNWMMILIAMACGAGLVVYIPRLRRSKPIIQTATQFEAAVARIFQDNAIKELMIFGYTSETVRNYLRYEHLYNKDLRIRTLRRCWNAEHVDECAQNECIKHLDVRPWDKSRKIAETALESWNYPAHNEVRFYDYSHPILKAVVIKSAEKAWAFVSFYTWQELPSGGGSQFKGDDKDMVVLSSDSDSERRLIAALSSQFELIWKRRSHAHGEHAGEYHSYLGAPSAAESGHQKSASALPQPGLPEKE